MAGGCLWVDLELGPADRAVSEFSQHVRSLPCGGCRSGPGAIGGGRTGRRCRPRLPGAGGGRAWPQRRWRHRRRRPSHLGLALVPSQELPLPPGRIRLLWSSLILVVVPPFSRYCLDRSGARKVCRWPRRDCRSSQAGLSHRSR
jgi:hypothetical protein